MKNFSALISLGVSLLLFIILAVVDLIAKKRGLVIKFDARYHDK